MNFKLIDLIQNLNSIETKIRLVDAKTLRKEQLKVINSQRGSLWDDGNILELYSGDGCRTL